MRTVVVVVRGGVAYVEHTPPGTEVLLIDMDNFDQEDNPELAEEYLADLQMAGLIDHPDLLEIVNELTDESDKEN